MVSYPAAECCNDYPSTMCEKNVQPMNPCLNQEDFLPDAYAYTSCDLSEVNPTKRQCEATPDCKEQWGWCDCKTKSACELLGGNFYGGTCQEELKWWSPGDHKGVKKALEKHTCQGVKGSYEGDIKYRVDWLGHSCCLSKSRFARSWTTTALITPACTEVIGQVLATLGNYSAWCSRAFGQKCLHRSQCGVFCQLPISVPFEKSCCEASCLWNSAWPLLHANGITRKDDTMLVGHFFVGKGIKRHSQVLNVQRGGGSYTQAADYWRRRSSDVFLRGFWQPCDLAIIY